MSLAAEDQDAGVSLERKRPRASGEFDNGTTAIRRKNQSIDHAEEAEESLVGIALSSFFEEANLPGVTKDSLQECLEKLRSTVQSIPEGDVDDKAVKNVLDMFRFSGMVCIFEGIVICCHLTCEFADHHRNYNLLCRKASFVFDLLRKFLTLELRRLEQ